MRTLINTCIIYYYAIGFRLIQLVYPNVDDL